MDLTSTYLPDILNIISRGLMQPAMACILILVVICIFFIGQVLVEYFCERRHYKQNMPTIVNDLNNATYENVSDVILKSKLLKFQKAALITASRNMGLPEESLFSLAQMEIGSVQRHYQRRLAWTDTISKIGPLLGLMATLIPLGPGIVALGQNDVTLLSASLGVAFDATVCGLVCAVTALIISKIRSGWYTEYIDSLESIMGCVVEKADEARKLGVVLPSNYTEDPMKEVNEAGARAKEAMAAKSAEAKEGKAARAGAVVADAEAESGMTAARAEGGTAQAEAEAKGETPAEAAVSEDKTQTEAETQPTKAE